MSDVVEDIAFSQPGCKDPFRDPHVKLGPEYREALGSWCMTKKASSGFLWVLFATYIVSLIHLTLETHHSSATRSSVGRIMRTSAAEERRGARRGTAVSGQADVGFVSVDARREEHLKEQEEEEASGHRVHAGGAFPSAHYQAGKPGWNPDNGEMFRNHHHHDEPGLNVLLLDEQRFAPARFPHALRVAGMIVPAAAAADADTDDRDDDTVTEVVGRQGGGGGGGGGGTGYTTVAGNGGAKRKGWWEADVMDGGGTLYNENERFLPLGAALPRTATTTPTLTTFPTTATTRPMNTAPNGGMRLPSHSFSRNVDLGDIARNLRSDQSQLRGYQQVQVQVQGQTHTPRSEASRGGLGLGLGGEHERGISRTMILASEGEGDDPCELSAPLTCCVPVCDRDEIRRVT
ncbi:hypothetical protein QFC24_004583 [Naganishia onofrii]|uniref:Uncharacterized protein n=1 Tax=Naganishia onofrii TaxID=1851511 RepID=A0ACC2XEH1_9TREE|nr:hypothetical protein QFC24_004583 [Naganishia onofrii]